MILEKMAYAGIQMFMKKLNQLINCTDNPFINNPAIISERSQFQLLYDNLGSMIQTIFIEQHQDLHDLEKHIDLKRRITDAAEEAQYILDLFLSGVHLRNNGNLPSSEDFNPSINLGDVSRSFKSLEVEFMSMRIESMKVDSSQRTQYQSAFAQISPTRNPLGPKKVVDVRLDDDAEVIRDKLVEDQKKVDVVSIVGMGGIGKTTLATKVFNDGYVKHHFYVRVWVTVSQTYDKRTVLIQILASIGVDEDLIEGAGNSRLHELVHKNLTGKRYLIVIDDIWHTKTWDNLKLFFPHNNNGSRLLLTSRFTEVAKHANSDGLIHHLKYLNKEKGWELLCHKVFQGNDCPTWSTKPGMQIVENCKGLPLAVVVIGGVLAKEAHSQKFWLETAEKTGSYISSEENGCLETLGLSYNHLPLHLRECFLYLGGFPEDHEFEVQSLIWLWIAEGFIEEDKNRNLEDTAAGYLMDLIDRNLVTIARTRNYDGAFKDCKLHDLVRELCLKKAKEEGFAIETQRPVLSSTPPYKPLRMFINNEIDILDYPCSPNLRSILCFRSSFTSVSGDFTKCFHSFLLLRVLDIYNCTRHDFPEGIELLVHLRYLAIWNASNDFPSSICNLWNLQTLIYRTARMALTFPSNISDLVNLRHLWSYHPNTAGTRGRTFFFLPSIKKPMNLQTISLLELQDESPSLQKYFPCVKKLNCISYSQKEHDFKSLTCLESLKLYSIGKPKNHITFPITLKRLDISGLCLPWSDMPIVQSLPNLQVLKLNSDAFEGSCWNTYEQEFPMLKFLRLNMLNIKIWEANSTSFPCLRQLEIIDCKYLEEIPFEIGDIPTLELIKIEDCRDSVGESVRSIQQEQHDMGNYDLKIDITKDKGSSQWN